ncbi:enolase C-terminal domain-like protein [Microbacterium sp. P01]|uniref:enolase C-terminal domain-like protein n=1 Tax=unclassified Microbacterium TaxID=2609290 RepID=UPI00367326E6
MALVPALAQHERVAIQLIESVTIRKLEWEAEGRRQERGFYPTAYDGGVTPQTGFILEVRTDAGITGEYTWTTGINGHAADHIRSIAPWLIGHDAMQRERIWNELRRVWRKYDQLGLGPLDCALWDLAGKTYGVPLWELLGGYRKRLPAYASTLFGDDAGLGPLGTPAAYAEFATYCVSLGYRAIKLHGWNDGDIRREIELVFAVREAVGPDIALMLDPSGAYNTFGDVLTVGRALDEANFYWYEDPGIEGGNSAFAYRKLRELLKTPFLQGEHIRGLQLRMDNILAGGTDFMRADAGLDGGVTGVMKTAHAAEALGVDVELHATSAVHRHLMASIRNSNFYELGLVAPSLNEVSPPFFESYADRLDEIDSDGTVGVPDGPGLGTPLDRDWIIAHQTDIFVAD